MKIGVLVQYLDTRSDLLRLLELLSVDHEITAFVPAKDFYKIDLKQTAVSFIPIKESSGFGKFVQILWKYFYVLFGKIPASRYNYYMTENVKLLNPSYNILSRFIQSILLKTSRFTPKILSYDQYLATVTWLDTSSDTKLDMDIFLCFTEIFNDRFFSKILKSGKPTWTYVYSWDHACKMKNFSKRGNYLVWNEGIKDDLIRLHHIKPNQIYVWGATQFTFINEFLNLPKETNPSDFDYIYLGCSTGYDPLTVQEVKYCAIISDCLKNALPTWKLVIRPYPFQKNGRIYDSLTKLSNVVFDKSYKRSDKFTLVKNARAFFHFGTTMGYEACYFDTPSFLMDFVDVSEDELLHNFIHQYQNDKYLNRPDSLVIKNISGLREIFENLAHQKRNFYTNRSLQSSTELFSTPDLAEKLLYLMKVHTANQMIL